MQTIGLTYDLRDEYLREGFSLAEVAELDQEETISALQAALRSLGHRVVRIGSARALAARLVAGERWDLVFNVAEGIWGRSREAQVPALLELYGVAYTFSDPLTSAITLDKAIAKRLVMAAGIHTPPFAVVQEASDIQSVQLRYPLFAKPSSEGTGRGISERSRVDNPEQLEAICVELLRDLGQPVLVEEYLNGREFTVGILGSGRAARAIGAMEVHIAGPTDQAVYTHEIKENWHGVVRYTPVADPELRTELLTLGLRAYRALECRDLGRVDIRQDRLGRAAFIEVNPMPGLHPTHSDLPMLARQEGMSFEALLGAVVESALERRGQIPERIARMGLAGARAAPLDETPHG